MGTMNNLRAAHRGSVNSIFVNLEAGIVIGMDEDSIRIWDPVKGVELQVFETKDGEEQFVPAMSSMYRFV